MILRAPGGWYYCGGGWRHVQPCLVVSVILASQNGLYCPYHYRQQQCGEGGQARHQTCRAQLDSLSCGCLLFDAAGLCRLTCVCASPTITLPAWLTLRAQHQQTGTRCGAELPQWAVGWQLVALQQRHGRLCTSSQVLAKTLFNSIERPDVLLSHVVC